MRAGVPAMYMKHLAETIVTLRTAVGDARAVGVFAVVLLVIGAGAREGAAQALSCTRGPTTPVVLVRHDVTGEWEGATEAARETAKADAKEFFARLARVFVERLRDGADGVEFVANEEFLNHLNNIALQQLGGRDYEGLLEETQLGNEFVWTLGFNQRRQGAPTPPARRTVLSRLINTRKQEEVTSRTVVAPLSDTDDVAEGEMTTLAEAMAAQLYCALQGTRLVPVKPELAVTVTPDAAATLSAVRRRTGPASARAAG